MLKLLDLHLCLPSYVTVFLFKNQFGHRISFGKHWYSCCYWKWYLHSLFIANWIAIFDNQYWTECLQIILLHKCWDKSKFWWSRKNFWNCQKWCLVETNFAKEFNTISNSILRKFKRNEIEKISGSIEDEHVDVRVIWFRIRKETQLHEKFYWC